MISTSDPEREASPPLPDDAALLRASVLEEFSSLLPACGFAFHRLVRDPRVPGLLRHGQRVVGPLAERLATSSPVPVRVPSVHAEPKSSVQRFTSLDETDLSAPVREVWREHGIITQLGTLIEADGVLIGWLGGWRCEDRALFKSSEISRVQSRLPEWTRRLVLADTLDARPTRSGASMVLAEDGSVEQASAEIDPWLDPGFASAVADLFTDGIEDGAYCVPGGLLELRRVTPLGSPGASPRFVATVQPVENSGVPPITSLSTQQRRVAEYGAAGATVPEIARTLKRSPETIRYHLQEVYRRLGISSRAELAVLVHDAWS